TKEDGVSPAAILKNRTAPTFVDEPIVDKFDKLAVAVFPVVGGLVTGGGVVFPGVEVSLPPQLAKHAPAQTEAKLIPNVFKNS
ncbi:MAG: hypothetical protein H7098_07165, partial [Oligoflexus sp.]|nr:hypothetical protein [Pseudopedobacter sp.]